MEIMKTVNILLVLLIGITVANPTDRRLPTCPSAPLNLFTTPTVPQSPSHTQTNSTCPSGDDVRSHWPISRSAMCPWSYVSDYDANRFPATISQAVCSCAEQGCLDPFSAEPRPDLQCTPVEYRLPVLRRGDCVDGVYDVVQEFETVAVACACMRQEGHAIRAPGMIGS